MLLTFLYRTCEGASHSTGAKQCKYKYGYHFCLWLIYNHFHPFFHCPHTPCRAGGACKDTIPLCLVRHFLCNGNQCFPICYPLFVPDNPQRTRVSGGLTVPYGLLRSCPHQRMIPVKNNAQTANQSPHMVAVPVMGIFMSQHKFSLLL